MTDIHITSCHETGKGIYREQLKMSQEVMFGNSSFSKHEKDYVEILVSSLFLFAFVVMNKHFLGALAPRTPKIHIFVLGRAHTSCDLGQKCHNFDDYYRKIIVMTRGEKA